MKKAQKSTKITQLFNINILCHRLISFSHSFYSLFFSLGDLTSFKLSFILILLNFNINFETHIQINICWSNPFLNFNVS